MNGFTKVFLTTLTWMEAACEFYKKNGYEALDVKLVRGFGLEFDIPV